MALDTQNSRALISGPGINQTMKNPKVYITRNCSVRGKPVKPGETVSVMMSEAHQIIAAKRGEMFDPNNPDHKKAKSAKVPPQPGTVEEMEENSK